jgi:uncharacterized protein YndB with AHSA1/START domain
MKKGINENAPATCRMDMVIDAPVERVWGVIAGIDAWPTWNMDVGGAKLDGPLAVGTAFDWKAGGARIRSILHTVEEGKCIGWTGKAFGAFAVHNWTLAAVDGGTKVLVEESMEGLVVRVFRGYFRRSLEKGMGRWLEALRGECEGVV